MGYRWKPSKAQRAEYAEKMRARDELKVIESAGAIRVGCRVEWFNVARGAVMAGEVTRSTYGEDGQHTFTIVVGGESVCVKGRNLYPNLLNHIQGEDSKNVSRI